MQTSNLVVYYFLTIANCPQNCYCHIAFISCWTEYTFNTTINSATTTELRKYQVNLPYNYSLTKVAGITDLN